MVSLLGLKLHWLDLLYHITQLTGHYFKRGMTIEIYPTFAA